MRSKLAKVLHPLAGRPLLFYSLDVAERSAAEGVVVVIGFQADRVKAAIEERQARRADRRAAALHGIAGRDGGLTAHVAADHGEGRLLLAEQARQLGTGDAVKQARAVFERARGRAAARFLILNGDTPLLSDATVRRLIELHSREQAAVSLLTARLEDPTGYGRIVRGADGAVQKIVEERDASEAERAVHEINAGTYVIEASFLFEALDRLEPHNAQREYYLTDVVGLAVAAGRRVSALVAPTAEEALGINTRAQLASAARLIRDRINAGWMAAGVTLRDPTTTWIDADVELGQDTVLYPNVVLEGHTRLGDDCVVHAQARISDSRLGDRVTVLDSCVIREAHLEDDVVVGPFAHLRPGSVLRRGAKVGNFVEMKKAELGAGSKANHLTYLGDARIGNQVNIGAGTITCNYDGVRKHETVIEDDVFVGSDAQFVAPVRIGRGAVVAAGSIITTDVPADALAIARAPQVTRAGWASKRRSLPASAASGSGAGAAPAGRGAKPRASTSKLKTARSKTRKAKRG